MSLELNAKLGILNSYGPRTVEGKYGAVIDDDVIKTVVYDLDFNDMQSTSAWAVDGHDLVIPAYSHFLRCIFIVDEAVVGPTAFTAGTYLASDGTTAIDADGLMTAAVGLVSAMDAVGDMVVGTGAQLTTGTGSGWVLSAPAVIRILPTVAAATAGKIRVLVQYVSPVP
jgi:hypothetical protein